MTKPAILALEDGTLLRGRSVGFDGETVGEVVFNTAMSGYQEILSDPSYAKQIVTLTGVHVGNVGTNADDQESEKTYTAGLVVRNFSETTSNWRAEHSLSDYLQRHKIVAIADVDTRHLTTLLRDKGALRGCITTQVDDPERAINAAKAFAGLERADLAKEVTCKKSYAWPKRPENRRYHVVVYDYGVKHNILRWLVSHGCQLSIVPATTPADQVLAMQPDGILLSNGPGDPAACTYAIDTIKTLLEANIPMLGICLGCQLLALAAGASTYKMKFGHHGANHPVQDVRTGRVYITSQNHGFAIDEDSLPKNITVTHRSLFDGTLQGIVHNQKPAMAFQGHPEASPGPEEMAELFSHFTDLMDKQHA